MNRKEFRCEIDKLAELVEGWNVPGEVPALERDLALETLRRLYEAVRFGMTEEAREAAGAVAEPASDPAPETSRTVAESEAAPLPTVEEEPEVLDTTGLPDLTDLLILGSEPEPAPESVAESAPAAEPTPAADPTPAPVAESTPAPAAEPAPAPAVEPTPAPAAAPSAEPEQPSAEPEQPSAPEPAPAPVSASAPEAVPTPVPEPASAAAPHGPEASQEPKSAHSDPTLFGLEETARHRHKQRVIMSLYDTPEEPETPRRREPASASPFREAAPSAADPRSGAASRPLSPREALLSGIGTDFAADSASGPDPEPDPAPRMTTSEKAAAPERIATPGAVLGDVINHDVQTLADTIAPHRDVASELRRQEPVGDLRRAIGINDKFLLIRDLFEGDGAAYERAVGALNACGSLDDCMIYIAEHYAWNPDSDGARLLMELLERKFA